MNLVESLLAFNSGQELVIGGLYAIRQGLRRVDFRIRKHKVLVRHCDTKWLHAFHVPRAIEPGETSGNSGVYLRKSAPCQIGGYYFTERLVPVGVSLISAKPRVLRLGLVVNGLDQCLQKIGSGHGLCLAKARPHFLNRGTR